VGKLLLRRFQALTQALWTFPTNRAITVPSLETSVKETLKNLEQDIDQQEVEERDLDEGYQSHGKEQEFDHASNKDNEDPVEE